MARGMRIAMFEGYHGGTSRPANYGALIVTPGNMLASADALDAEWAKLDADIVMSSVSDQFRIGWQTETQAWNKFYAGLKGIGGYASRLWSGTQEQIDFYRARLVAWETSFNTAGGTTTGASTALPPPETSIFGALGSVGTIVKWGAIGLLAYVAAQAIGFIPRPGGSK